MERADDDDRASGDIGRHSSPCRADPRHRNGPSATTLAAPAGWIGGRLARIKRFTFVDVILWGLRVLALVVVVGGAAGTLLKARYDSEQWFDLVMFGLTIGGVYALLALGYTMVYGILRQINFAHGDIMMSGAFTAYFAASAFKNAGLLDSHAVLAMTATVLVAMAVCTAVALIVERICYRPFRHVRTLAPLICAIGTSFFLQHTFRGMYGSTMRSFPDTVWLKGDIGLFGAALPKVQLLVIVTASAAMLLIYLIVHRTRMGKAMRAVSEDRDAAALMGIDINKVIAFTFTLGASMAGIGGVLYMLVYKQVYFFMGFLPGIKAFTAAVLGGIGNIPGAMLGGIRVIESVGPALFLDGLGVPAPYQLRDAIAFTVLIMVLIFRPEGILGERRSKRA
jgi:branched-chain amino acid transport system permease protein